MQTRWNALVNPLMPDAARCNSTYQQLSAAYSGSGRYYHDLRHVQALLDTVDEYAGMVVDREVVELAVWFHDAVYNYLSSENEALSAELARQFLAHSTLSAERQARVAYLIECTTRHAAAHAPAPDLDFFLDADLRVLGAEPADYAEYAQQIRQEYRLVPAVLYRRGRRKVLEQLLAAPALYRTAAFHDRFEAAARRNLRAELNGW
ncbi:HD domain-containing protein [Hymenobacter lapidiphilus]|uniref:Metal-dependent phosphohydrolase n=1 Tax=Hymenobacter lapidiphilus TaxID=2608003 RepID=A0A7Y7U742_9BACT|nr:metal-dependent phosphohydrolase [Hymenobacter lapidiphilus]NVO33178.1 metal-dependent phosphohydrolase [Hymenobacter lapidiphilus]